MRFVWQRTTAGKTVSGNLPKYRLYIMVYKSDNYQFFRFVESCLKKIKNLLTKMMEMAEVEYTTQPIIKTASLALKRHTIISIIMESLVMSQKGMAF